MQLAFSFEANPILPRARESLIATYGSQRDEHRYDPTTQFVKAMLSSCTRDAVSEEAFQRLRIALPCWHALPDADHSTVLTPIGGGEYATKKAIDLVAAARIIRARRGEFNLAFLADWPVEF